MPTMIPTGPAVTPTISDLSPPLASPSYSAGRKRRHCPSIAKRVNMSAMKLTIAQKAANEGV